MTVRPRLRSVASFLWGRSSVVPIGSLAIAVALLLVFGFERWSGSWQYEVTNLRHAWGWSHVAIRDLELWRLVTPALLHSDIPSSIGPLGTVHLLANLFSLAVFAPRFERRHGRLLLFGAFSAFHIASFSVWAITGTPGSYFGVGASGAIVGLAAAVIADGIRQREWRYVIALTLFSVWWWWPDGLSSSDQVHLGGLIAGASFAVLTARPWAALAVIAATGSVITVTTTPSLPPEPTRLSCPDQGYEWSGGDAARVLFTNPSHRSVDLHWIRPDGQRNFIAQLRPGEHLIDWSFVGHRYAVTADRGDCFYVAEV